MEKGHIFKNFDSEDWTDKDFTGHKFYYCQLTNVRISPSTKLYGVEWHGCTATYIEAEGVTFDHLLIQYCDLRGANLKNTTWKRSRIHDSKLHWASLEGADLSDCSGEGSDFYLSRIQKAAGVNPFDRDMIAELIRVRAHGDSEMLMIAALVKNSRDVCWREFKTYAEMPQWKRVAAIIYPILESYPSINSKIQDGLIKGD